MNVLVSQVQKQHRTKTPEETFNDQIDGIMRPDNGIESLSSATTVLGNGYMKGITTVEVMEGIHEPQSISSYSPRSILPLLLQMSNPYWINLESFI